MIAASIIEWPNEFPLRQESEVLGPVDLHALLGGHIGLVQHEHDGQVQLGELGGEEEVAEEVRRVDDHDHGIGAAVIGKVTGERVDDDLLIG